MSSQRPTTKQTTSSQSTNLENTDPLSIANLSISEESNESDKKKKAQSALDAARERLNASVNAPRKPGALLSPLGLPMKAGSSLKASGTKLSGRDGASILPASTRLGNRDIISLAPFATRLTDRDYEPISFKSMKPQGTLLQQRDYFASMAPGTKLNDRDIKSILPDQETVERFTEVTGIPKSFAPSASVLPANLVMPSAIKTSDDAVKAVDQTYFKELTAEEKEDQLKWVESILAKADPCPQGKKVSFSSLYRLCSSFAAMNVLILL